MIALICGVHSERNWLIEPHPLVSTDSASAMYCARLGMLMNRVVSAGKWASSLLS